MGILHMLEAQITRLARTSLLATLSKIQHGKLTLEIKDGTKDETLTFGPSKSEQDRNPLHATVTILDPSVWTRLCSNLDAGFAESYMLQHLSCAHLLDLFLLYLKNWAVLGSGGNPLFQLVPHLFRLLRPTNDAVHALRNAAFHYDTSNELFAGFLSADMNYSSAVWSSSDHGEALETAQMRKIHKILDKARISSTDHVLDIGGGWGSLAIEAVRWTGCRVTATTLSREQKGLFEERVRAAGFADRIRVVLCDYRGTPRPEAGYDRVVSVEMLEHVGREHMQEYFASISRLLKEEGGIMVVQGITMINKFHNFRNKVDNFIDRYVFPGGYLPNINGLLASIQAGSKGSLEVETVESIGPHYIRTLRLWGEKFDENWPSIKESYTKTHSLSDTDLEAFRRRWKYYFLYCEAGFRAGVLGDHIISAVRRPMPDLPTDVPL